MLEPLSLLVHVVPGKAEARDEVRLDDAVPADETERDDSTGGRQPRAAIPLSAHQAEAAEAKDSRRRKYFQSSAGYLQRK